MSPGLVDGLIVFGFGAAVGVGELVSRYRDAPGRALKAPSAVFYILINATAAVLALSLIRGFGWTLGVDAQSNPTALRWTQVLAAGFGSVALFRSALFTVRAGDHDIPMGPSAFLQAVLGAADRAVDRSRAGERAKVVADAMAGIPFSKAQQALPTLCLALMQNVPKDDQSDLAQQIAILNSSSLDDRTKALVLGLHLMNVVGEGVIVDAIVALGSQIATITRVELEAPTKSPVGSQFQVKAQAFDGGGRPARHAQYQWSSSDLQVASVSSSGLVSAMASGTVRIEAACDGVVGHAVITVK